MSQERGCVTLAAVRPVLLFVLAAAAALWLAHPAVAPAQSTHIEASIRASQARQAQRRGDLDEAVRLYREAIAMGAPPQVFRDLAIVLEQQGRLRSAAGAWTRYAALAPTEAEQSAALARREALRRMPSVLRVRVTPRSAAREARVWFDRDRPRYVPAGGAETLVEGGTHRVRVEAPGFLPWEMMVPTAFGEPVEVVAAMRPDPRATTQADAGR